MNEPRKFRETAEAKRKRRMNEIRAIENPKPSEAGEMIHLLTIEWENIQDQLNYLEKRKEYLINYLPKLAETYRERADLIEAMVRKESTNEIP